MPDYAMTGNNEAMVGLQVQSANNMMGPTTAAMSGFFTFYMIMMFIFSVLVLVGMWKVFKKAGKPGWAVLIPFYNLFVLLQIVGRPGWWLVLYFVPVVNFVVSIIVFNDLSKSFGRGVGTTLGLIFFPYIFFVVLGMGNAEYKKPALAK